MATFLLWLKFAVCVLIILIAGTRVARYADVIAAKTGVGRLWVGLLLLARVTSLPETFVGISSVVLVKAPDLTIGDLFGSNVFNLLILAFMDVAYNGRPLLTAASPRHLLPAGLSMVLVSLAVASVFISARVSDLGIGWIGVYTPVLIGLYLLMMRVIFKHEQGRGYESTQDVAAVEGEDLPLRRAYLGFAVAALFVIGAGTWLAFVGRDIAEATGWAQSFVGSLFVACTTSLPELSVSYAALRLGAVDMCVANVIGSNLFNMSIIGVDDLFYRTGPILASVSEGHALTGLFALAMTCVLMIGLLWRSQHKTRLRFSWYAPVLAGLYVLAAYVSFTHVG